MTTQPDGTPVSDLAPITDHERLRALDSVQFHEETDVVPPETVEQLDAAEDMAIVGVQNDDGETLLRRLTDTCSWKLPVATVGDGTDYAEAIREQVTENVGSLDLETVVGVWHVDVRTESTEERASRTFVVFAGTLEETTLSVPDDGVTEADWFEDFPEDWDELPGTHLFLG